MAERPPSTMPGWMKLLFLVFIAYVLYVGNFTSGTSPVATPIAEKLPDAAGPAIPTPDNAASREKNYNELSNFLDADRWRRALNPEHVGGLDIKELEYGSGSAAGCGSEVTVRYRGTIAGGANFDETHDERELQRFVLGEAPIAAMNEGLIGMQQGGVRQLKAPQQKLFEGNARKMDSVLFRVEMDSASPVSGADTLPFAMMQVAPAISDALPQAKCGEPVHARLVWFDTKGEISERAEKTWVLGNRSVSVGVDRATHGMREGEVRFAVLPPAWHPFGAHIANVLIVLEPLPKAEAKK